MPYTILLLLLGLGATLLGVLGETRSKETRRLTLTGWMAITLAALTFFLSVSQEISKSREAGRRMQLAYQGVMSCLRHYEGVLEVLDASRDSPRTLGIPPSRLIDWEAIKT